MVKKKKEDNNDIIIGFVIIILLSTIFSVITVFNSDKIDGLMFVDKDCYRNITKTYCEDNNYDLISRETDVICQPINSTKSQKDVNIEIERLAEAQC